MRFYELQTRNQAKKNAQQKLDILTWAVAVIVVTSVRTVSKLKVRPMRTCLPKAMIEVLRIASELRARQVTAKSYI